MPALTVQNAEIKTAAVEVRTLTISGKQVTLAVFRQLQSASWLDANSSPRGQAWGCVNYCPDRRCGYDNYGSPRNHRHVVWQLGTELRRALVIDPAESHHRYESDEARKRRIEAWVAVLRLPQLFIAV